ncbi:transposable element Tc1 transposase [Trichonephila clavipes]|nr:transposable element Tc1 transposase [Trichonephila clavipes]
MRVSKQWTDEGRTGRKSVSGPRNVTSAREDRRLVRMAQTDRTAFSRQLAAQRATTTRVSLIPLTQNHCRLRWPDSQIPQNHCRLRLHWANVHRSWRADWQQVVFSDKSRSAQGFLYTGFLSRKTIAACDYFEPMCIGAGVLIGSRSSFLTNPAARKDSFIQDSSHAKPLPPATTLSQCA